MVRWIGRKVGGRLNVAEIAGMAAVIARPDGRFRFVSGEARRLLGRHGRMPQSWTDTTLSSADAAMMATLSRRVRTGGQNQTQMLGRYGGGCRMEVRLHAVSGAGEVLALFSDSPRPDQATDADLLRLRVDNQIWAAELQHRVRNTLHVLSAMIYFDRENSEDSTLRLEQVQGRILAMAQAHDTLEVRDGVALVDLATCIRSLHVLVCAGHGMALDALPLSLETEGAPLAPSIDVAVPLVLIIYEIFSAAARNCRDCPNCVLSVGLRQSGARVRLRVSGLCVGGDALNLRLIEAMVKQLRADFTMDSGDGFTLSFSP